MSKKEFFIILSGFLIWRLLIGWGMNLAPNFLPNQPSFPYIDRLESFGLPKFLTSPGNFDGVHYLTISQKGYKGTALVQAFFPVYPLTITVFSLIFTNPLLSAQIISHFATLGFACLLYIFMKKNFSTTTAWWSLAAVALFPTSFYLISVYNESLFLLILMACLILYQKKSWRWLSLCLILLTAVRITGIVLVIAFLISYCWQTLSSSSTKPTKQLSRTSFWQPIIYIALGSLGLIAYMVYLGINFKEPLLFFHVQDDFGAARQTSLVLWPQVVWRYLKMVLYLIQNQQLINWKSFSYLQEFILAIGGFTLIGLQLIFQKSLQKIYHHFNLHRLRKLANYPLPLEIILFSFGSYLLPTLTGNFSSIPRYLLLSISLFMGFGLLKSKVLKITLLSISTALLIINLILFTQGYWVA